MIRAAAYAKFAFVIRIFLCAFVLFCRLYHNIIALIFSSSFSIGLWRMTYIFCPSQEKEKRIEIVVSSFAIFYLMDSNLVVHNGGCHCGKVRWRVQAPSSVVAWNCNCSNCSMRSNIHFIVPSKNFDLAEDSKQFIATYTFGTHTAKHTFCKVCGITSFYIPRSNPDGVAVTYKCVDPGTLAHVEIKHYNGLDWESSYGQTGIAACSNVQMEESQ